MVMDHLNQSIDSALLGAHSKVSFATHFVGDDGELIELFGLDEINGEFTCCDRVVLKTSILKNSPICAFHHAPISAFFETTILDKIMITFSPSGLKERSF